ncbi:MAG: alpha/beta fold hydrolase [Bacteroidota bacterium]
MSILLSLILLLVLYLISAALVVFVVGPLILLQPTRRKKEWYARSTTFLEPRGGGLPQEDLFIPTHDGLRLHAWLVRRPRKAKGTVLYLHGVGDCKIGGLPITKLLYDHGYHVFLFDSRQHGESEGKYCTYGFYEKHDVATVLTYLRSRKGLRTGKIGVFGTSMGAAVAIQTAAMDSRIAAVVAEASFTDLRTIVVDYQKSIIKLPWHFLRNLALSRSQQIGRFRAREVSPVNDVRLLRTPVLFIHGMVDSSIKYEYSKTLYHYANEPKELLLIPGANHTDTWEVGGRLYEDTLLSFFDRHLR